MALTQWQHDSFIANGYLVAEGLIAAKALAQIRRRIDTLQDAAIATKSSNKGTFQLEESGTALNATKPALRKLDNPARRDRSFLELAQTPAILNIVAELTGGPRVLLYSDQVFMKPAFCGTEKPLHQDNSYFKVTPHTAGITCWMAIDDSTTDNGCLYYMPGTHRLGLIKHRQMATKAHLTLDGDVPLPEPVMVPVRAGSCIFHHLLVMHGSKANASPHSRRAYAVHYVNGSAEHSVKSLEEMIPLR